MFERPRGGEVAVIVHIDFPHESPSELSEFIDLVTSAGAEIAECVQGKRRTPDPKYFVGKGKADEIRQKVVEAQADVVIFDHSLTPAQERNLEQLVQCRVLDRTGLILDIFAQRARTFEGKLQVELAQLNHLSTRLVRGWTHLERQKGGIGLRGPGETQLESDRRLLANRIKQIKKRLDKVKRQRGLSRRARQRAEVPTVSLVGYTNAGKSTLFNQLTGANVFAEDQLFATLDPTLRRVEVGEAGPLIFVDTVGFVSNLPHDLVAAFRATLEETLESDVLLHVIDAPHPERNERIRTVNEVLAEIGADSVPQVEVYNKIDLVSGSRARQETTEGIVFSRVWLSANTGEGVPELVDLLKDHIAEQVVHCRIFVPHNRGDVRAQCYELKTVLNETASTSEDGWLLDVEIQKRTLARLLTEEVRVVEKEHVDPSLGTTT